jgi:hypothetical protein
LTHLDIVNGNAAGSVGGGIHNQGTLTLNHSTVSGNHAAYGGGIFNYYSVLTLNNSTLSGNSAVVHGGGIYNQFGTLTLNHSTLSGNSAALGGGGIYNEKGTLTLNHSTLTANIADSDSNGSGDGGGVYNWDGTLIFKNSLVAGNDDRSTPGNDDCSGSGITSQGHNLVGSGTGCNLAGSGDQTTSDPKLGALADNGGPTWTHALLAGSPAIDAIPNGVNGCGDTYTQDQRGVPRPIGGACDVGAYEAGAAIWDGGGSDGNWSTAANWSGDTAPTASSVVVFNDTSDASATMDAPFTVAGLFIGDDYDGAINAGSYDLAINGSYQQLGGSFTAPAGQMTVSGDLIYSGGSFDPNHGTVTFAGAGTQTLDAGAIAFYNLTVNSGSTLDLGTATAATVDGALTVNGALKQTRDVNNATIQFLRLTDSAGTTDKHFGVELTTTGDLGSTAVTVAGNQVCAQVSTGSRPVKRCFTVTPTTAASATLKFYFRQAELQTGQTLGLLNVWRYDGATWQSVTRAGDSGACAEGAINCYVAGTTAAYSPFVLQQTNPLAVRLADFTAAPGGGGVRLTWETVSELDNLGFHLYRVAEGGDVWLRLDTVLIPSQAPGAPGGYAYTWLDRSVQRGTTYRYRLEAVGLSGQAQRLDETTVCFGAALWLPIVMR